MPRFEVYIAFGGSLAVTLCLCENLKEMEKRRQAMVKMIEALFDGTVFHPAEPIALAPNTRVRMTIETVLPAEGKATSFLRTARALNLEGPPDWSANIDEYLYGGDPSHAD
jgi:predicted DNA-binding antitoxin AbrB/MazE fold protein